jgi:hypothetical protein
LPKMMNPAEGSITLSDRPFALPPEQVGTRFNYGGCEYVVPANTSLHWPALPHNPYVKDGQARSMEEGRIELRIPLDAAHPEHRLNLNVK